MTDTYQIYVYISFDSDVPDYKFTAKGSRGLVGIMKTIADNYDIAHVDIISEEKFYNIPKGQTRFNR